jgi:hypothetical protein
MRLQSGHLTDEANAEDTDSKLRRKAMLVYEGTFQSMDGEITLSSQDLQLICDQYNSGLEKMKRFLGGGPKVQVPVQLDHSPKSVDTVGRVDGPITMGSFTDEDGKELAALYGELVFIGKDNVEKAKDGRWTHLSIGLEKNSKLTEVSVTPFPAAPHASLLSKKLGTGELDMGYSSVKKMHEKYAKCKKHLMDSQKMSEEDADKHLESAKDEDLSRMEKEHDENEEKMKKKMSEEKGTEEGKELSKLRNEIVELRKDQENVRLATRKLSVATKISRLRAMGKITPAEIKKIDIVRLAKSSDEALEEVLKAYELRQPVISIGQVGSTKASDPSKVAAELKRLNKLQMEADSKANMSFTGTALKNMEKARLADAMPKGANSEHLSESGGAMPGGPNSEHMADKPSGSEPAYADMEKDFETMHALMAGGKHLEAAEHVKNMHEKMKAHMAGKESDGSMENVEQHMKEVEDAHKTLARRLETVTL